MKRSTLNFIALLVVLFFIFSTRAYSSEKVYVINIASSLNTFKSIHLPVVDISKNDRFYTVQLKFRNRIWNRLRLGFFNDKQRANTALQQVKKYYPDAFIGLVPSSEIKYSRRTKISHSLYPVEYLIFKAADLLMDSASGLKLTSSDSQSTTQEVDHYYIINLKTASNLYEFDSIIKTPEISRFSLYISDMEIDDRTWYQYRLGFFTSRKVAEQQLQSLRNRFPLARLIRISPQEKQIATAKIRKFTASISPALDIKRAAPEKNPLDVYKALIKEGTSALSKKRYNDAVIAFNKLLSYPENPYSKDAQELLGFSYELNRQISEARRAYERYLSLYPESNGAIRVQQRIASMITARKPTPAKLKQASRLEKEPRWDFFGSLSQFYRRDTSSFDITSETETTVIRTTDKRVNLSEVDTLLSLNARRRSSDSEIRTRLTGGYIYDMKDTDESNKAPLNELYFDYLNLNNQFSIRAGRQSSNKGGVFGRFDGIDTGYRLSDWLRINLTTGYQVNSVYHSADSDTFFTSIRSDFGTFFNAWDFSLYYMKQQQESIIGREAIGTEFRYFHPTRSLFGLVDHDILFDRLNTALITGTWITDSRISYNVTIDYRHTPLLNIKNALIGQTILTIDEMLESFSEIEVLDIAIDRTTTVKSLIAGISYPIADDYTFNADISATEFSSTEASAGVEALPASGPDYYLNLQLVGTNVFSSADSNITGISYSSTDLSDTLSLRWNYRIHITPSFRLNPRLSISKRENTNSTDQSIVGMALKLDYRIGRKTSLELDFGGESSDKTLISGEEKNDVYFLNLGYQHNF